MKGEWMTEANLAFVEEQYVVHGKSTIWIGRQLGLTKNPIIGHITRKGLCRQGRPKLVRPAARPKIADLWSGTVIPEWHSQEANDLVRLLWGAQVLAHEIEDFFHISTAKWHGKKSQLNLPLRGDVIVRIGAGGIQWATDAGDTELRRQWLRGDTEVDIRRFFGVGRKAFLSRKNRLNFPKRQSPVIVQRQAAAKAIADAVKLEVAPPPLTRGPIEPPRAELYVERQIGRGNGRSGVPVLHGIGYWNEVKACLKPVFAPGQCHWALRCDAAAVGNWCSEHAKMIGRRAG